MTTTKTSDSPRIALLQQAIESGNTGALAMFWQEIAKNGAPLIEAIEGDGKHHLVTLVWRDKGETKNTEGLDLHASWLYDGWRCIWSLSFV